MNIVCDPLAQYALPSSTYTSSFCETILELKPNRYIILALNNNKLDHPGLSAYQ